MRTLLKIHALPSFILSCNFDNGVSMLVDIKPLLDKEAFLPLKISANFQKVTNKSYFVEWVGLSIDLSADTLWHLGE